MTKSGRLVSAGITHAAALLVGWGGWTAFRHSGTAEAPAGVSTQAQQRTKDGSKNLDEIFAIISPKPTEEKERRSTAGKFLDDFNGLVSIMAVPEDLKGAVEAEIILWGRDKNPKPSARMAALMYFWAAKDFPSFLKWADSKDETRARVLSDHMQAVVEKVIETKGAKAMFSIPSDADWSPGIIYYTAGVLAKSPNLDLIAEAKEMLDPKLWRKFKGNVTGTWPWEEKSKLLEFAISENQPDMISRLAQSQRENGGEAGAWLLELMDDETIDASFREKLAKDEGVRSFATSEPKMPLASRIALLQGGEQGDQSDQAVFDRITINDVESALRGDQDWYFEFRNGTIEADEVLAALTDQFPEQAARAPEDLRNTLFHSLIEEDSVRAMELLKNLPPADQTSMVLESAKNAFFQVDPNRFLATLQQIQADDPNLWDARLDAWVKHGPYNLGRLDTEYVEWVRNLPEGVDRDMALYSLALASDENNPSLAAELRGEVKSEKLKQKIQQSVK